ncbi:MAG: type II toxin-antitoxin system VapC family toxin [Solirubrobacterales bacterium]
MRILLDTHVMLWALGDEDALSERGRRIVAEDAEEVLVSAASIWEASIKQSIGRLEVSGDLVEAAERAGFDELPIMARHAAAITDLPLHHRDPFDRMLVAQARVEGLTLATADELLAAYDVSLLDATR